MSLTTDLEVVGTVTAHPDAGDRLIAGVPDREGLDRYRATGGYAPVEDAEALLSAVEASGLRGRGGAAFPTGTKLRTVRSGQSPVVVANGEEGEPASVKDRWLLRHRPHLVLDGLRLAGILTGAHDLHVYVSDPAAESSVTDALGEVAEAGINWDAKISVTRVDPTYVAGEETAVVRALNGGPALPQDKPPRPFDSGVDGRPTLVSNVETLANLPLIQRLGADGYRAVGTADSPGTFLLTLTGGLGNGLYEVPFGLTVRQVLTWLGQDPDQVRALLMGGYFSGVLGAQGLDVTLDYDAMRQVGSGLGCGAIGVVLQDRCPVAVSAAVMAYFARENAQQCGSCFNGTAAMAAVLEGLVEYKASDEDVRRLTYWSSFLRGRGACGTLDGATNVAAALLREFPELVDAHVAGSCATCDAGTVRVVDPPFAVGLP
ncbi:NADH-ubiquinone oxidoreductase-F iron-sulfur binding region domain-containing protein [Pseudonocardia thermophila]|uniref:NADH-ubiquinone oxidoreductase-F iron-sulfur binding region domain-containing protein n=1 Tax=Pseudonocardia thermophila TaxID=1848 RepID=UPI00248D7670|nr:NADH-ubiquinone oxidoreductase-F iron-sulfur binding region domain-containing protein [Pseudonocardia thermophila]